MRYPAINKYVLCVVFLTLGSCSGTRESGPPSGGGLQADIRWTAYGIPHVKANDWAGLGYGFAYATARDGVCVIARELVLLDGQMTRYFGSEEGNRSSDVFHLAVLQPDRLAAYNASESNKSKSFSRGYIAGYNRYLRDHADTLPLDCNGEPWVRPMNDLDIAKMAIGVGIRYGLGRVQKEMAAAAPPTNGVDLATALQTDFNAPKGYGSNAIAMGRAVTASNRGLLFGNPHYPWEGPSRFHMIHATIPGELDVMGVSLITTPRVAIGFNRDVAWTHTVSTALRSTFYELQLNPDNPMQYRYEGVFRDIEEVRVLVAKTDEKGAVSSAEHIVYFSHYGPIVESQALPWDDQRAYAVRDANLANTRTGLTYDALNKARSVAEVKAALSLQGVAWTNTLAADRHGDALYADISVTPNVDMELLEHCRLTPAEVPARAVVLRGDIAQCEWKEDARSAIPGALPAQEMPYLLRDDYVANSNDSYWLSSPLQPLEGYSPIIGNEREARSLRTRAGLVFIEEYLDKEHKFEAQDLQQMLYSHRNYGAELLLDDLLVLCAAQDGPVQSSGEAVDISAACQALDAWDRRMTVSSRGGHVWREFWRSARDIKGVFATEFDVADPLHTPHTLNTGDGAVAMALLEALAAAQLKLTAAGIALDASVADIQYKQVHDERLPVPGGEGWAGMWSMIRAGLSEADGYTPIVHGNSFIQVISWDKHGKLQPKGILAYSQSPELDQPHSADMTRLYAEGALVDLPFSEEDIASDPALITLRLRE